MHRVFFQFLYVVLLSFGERVLAGQPNTHSGKRASKKHAARWESSRVYYRHGRLQYTTDRQGNRIPDFSYAGYMRGEKSIPDVPVVHSISPVDGDNSKHIQDAIDLVEAMPKAKSGFRGALLLKPGIYSTDHPVYAKSDGIVLRGSGKGDNPKVDTIIISTRTGTDDCVIGLGNRTGGRWSAEVANSRVRIVDTHIPIGQKHFTVTNAGRYRIGDQVVILHSPEAPWFKAVQDGGVIRDKRWSVLARNGCNFNIEYSRFITAIQGDRISVDVPFFYGLRSRLAKLEMYKYDSSVASGRLCHLVGIENMRISIKTKGGHDEDHTRSAVSMFGVVNGWVRNMDLRHFSYAGVIVGRSLFVTVENCLAGAPVSEVKGMRRYNFCVGSGGQQLLFRDNTATDSRHAFIGNGTTSSSGIAVVRLKVINSITGIEGGHRHWTQGVLFDQCKVESVSNRNRPTFAVFNRGDHGTSHGWASANCVIWNTDSSVGGHIIVQSPPTAQNYAIGCSGSVKGKYLFSKRAGFIEGTNRGKSLYPQSLYKAQLKDRLDRRK